MSFGHTFERCDEREKFLCANVKSKSFVERKMWALIFVRRFIYWSGCATHPSVVFNCEKLVFCVPSPNHRAVKKFSMENLSCRSEKYCMAFPLASHARSAPAVWCACIQHSYVRQKPNGPPNVIPNGGRDKHHTTQVFQLFRLEHGRVTWTPDSGDSRRV